MFKQKRKEEVVRQQKFEESSKDRLFAIVEKKIKTTMIGSLAAIEKRLKFLWEDGENALDFKVLYDSIREEILNIGNTQIRNVEKELEQYKVEWKRYTLNLPVRTEGQDGKDRS